MIRATIEGNRKQKRLQAKAASTWWRFRVIEKDCDVTSGKQA